MSDRLFDATRRGDIKAIRTEIKKEGVDVNASNANGSTSLMGAAVNGHTETVRELISLGAKVNQANNDGYTALIWAAGKGHTESVRELISLGANVDQANKNGNSALIRAAVNGHTNTVRELISLGANVDQADKDGYTALIAAAMNGHTKTVRELISLGANVVQTDNNGNTVLIIAALHGRTETVRELISLGAKVDHSNKDGYTALIWAAGKGHTKTVRELITLGANVDQADKDGATALIYAALAGHTKTVREFISLGANVDQANTIGNTSLMWAADKGHTETVRELISMGANVDHANKYGNTALMWTARNGHTETVRELISLGAKVDQANNAGKTALTLAKESQLANPDVIHLLEEAAENASTTKQQTHSQAIPVLPENWEVVNSKEGKQQFYRNTKTKEQVDSPPSGYPLFKNPSYPEVTLFDEPQEKAFSSSGGHVDFDNGVEISVPPGAVSPGTSLTINIQPGFAPKDVFVLPQGIQSASPSYLITVSGSSELNEDVTLAMEHHVKVNNDDDARNLVFLQTDTTPQVSDSGNLYEYKEVTEGSAKFLPEENTGKLTTRRLSDKFVKIGRRIKKIFHTTSKPPPPEPNLYTVKAYRSSLQTSGDRVSILAVSLFGDFYLKLLDKFDRVAIPCDYPEVSTKAIDKTTMGALSLTEQEARLVVLTPPTGWTVELDRDMISKGELHLPETENFRPEELLDYPPRIVCRFYPEDHTPPRTTCTLSITGFQEAVKVNVPLMAPKPQRQVDTRILQEAADKLRTTTVQVKERQLVPSVETILSLMEMISTTLCSPSSLEVLAAHTDSIEVEVQTVLSISRKVVRECSRPSIKADIKASLSEMVPLSHQLCLVTKVKLKHCRDPFEEAAALNDLVCNGAKLLNTVNRLLNYMNTLSQLTRNNTGYNVLVQCGEKIVGEFTKDPKTLAVQLHTKKFISDRTLAKTIELEEIKRDKAERLHAKVVEIVRDHPLRYSEFVSVLEDNRTLYSDLLKDLRVTHYKLSMPKLECFND